MGTKSRLRSDGGGNDGDGGGGAEGGGGDGGGKAGKVVSKVTRSGKKSRQEGGRGGLSDLKGGDCLENPPKRYDMYVSVVNPCWLLAVCSWLLVAGWFVVCGWWWLLF